MAQHIKKTEKNTVSGKITNNSESNSKPKTERVGKADFLSTLDAYFTRRTKLVFILSLVFTALFGALLFDLKISEGTDDSGYIVAAHDFIRGKAFPTWHGSFYPIFLSLPIMLFGIKLFVLKFCSYLMMIGHIAFFYLAFRNRLSATLLALVTLIVSVNSFILFHASSTFSEPLYFLLQSLTLYFFFKIIDKEELGLDLKQQWKLWLVFGFCSFLLSITRNVGLGILISLSLFFVINKKFKELAYTFGSFFIFYIPYSIYKSVVWDNGKAGFEDQFGAMFQKNPYNPSLGTEDFAGFVTRFFENCNLYLSKHFFKILGVLDENSTEKNVFLAVLVFLLFVLAFYMAIRQKNKIMQFVALYLAVAVGGTFVSQQTFWDLSRLIIIYIPLSLLTIGYGLYELYRATRKSYILFVLLGSFCLLFFAGFAKTVEKSKENAPVLSKNMQGDYYYGFTPDWVHFFKASEWAAANIAPNEVIGSRKPSMSFIYGKGREFFGIYKVPMMSVDSLRTGLENVKNECIVIDYYDFESKGLTLQSLDVIRPFNVGLVANDNHFYLIFNPTIQVKEQMVTFFSSKGVSVLNLDTFWSQIATSTDKYYAESPDFLVNYLKTNKIRFLILGSLRFAPAQNTGQIINTLHKIVYFIQIKYPNSFKVVHQVGEEYDEPAQVLMFEM
jgi:hypothetical protein